VTGVSPATSDWLVESNDTLETVRRRCREDITTQPAVLVLLSSSLHAEHGPAHGLMSTRKYRQW
jgi:hypothetical protein